MGRPSPFCRGSLCPSNLRLRCAKNAFGNSLSIRVGRHFRSFSISDLRELLGVDEGTLEQYLFQLNAHIAQDGILFLTGGKYLVLALLGSSKTELVALHI